MNCKEEIIFLTIIIFFIVGFVFPIAWFASHMEAKSYNKYCTPKVTTIDAFFWIYGLMSVKSHDTNFI